MCIFRNSFSQSPMTVDICQGRDPHGWIPKARYVCVQTIRGSCRKRKSIGLVRARLKSITDDSNGLEWLGIEREVLGRLLIEEEKMGRRSCTATRSSVWGELAYVIPNLQGSDWHCVGRTCLQSVTRRFLAWWLDHNKSHPDRRGTCSSLAASPEEVSRLYE